jgi:hypothetical protein
MIRSAGDGSFLYLRLVPSSTLSPRLWPASILGRSVTPWMRRTMLLRPRSSVESASRVRCAYGAPCVPFSISAVALPIAAHLKPNMRKAGFTIAGWAGCN